MRPTTRPHLRVCFYNIWGHRQPLELAEFLRSAMLDTDVFCFTEVTDMRQDRGKAPPTCYTSRTNRNESPSHLNGWTQLRAVLTPQFDGLFDCVNRDSWRCGVETPRGGRCSVKKPS